MGVILVGLAIIAFVVIGFIIYAVGVYNGLVRVKNNIKKAWGNIDVLLTQRSAELPKLVETVKGYMKHERETLEKVTQARNQMTQAHTVAEKAEADNMIHAALKSLFAVAEQYPDLKANQNFMQLQDRISGIENEIADRREFYNDSVNTYNIRIESFPDMIVAGLMGLKAEEMFKAPEAAREDVQIKF